MASVSNVLLCLTAVMMGLIVASGVGVYLLVRSFRVPPAGAYVAGGGPLAGRRRRRLDLGPTAEATARALAGGTAGSSGGQPFPARGRYLGGDQLRLRNALPRGDRGPAEAAHRQRRGSPGADRVLSALAADGTSPAAHRTGRSAGVHRRRPRQGTVSLTTCSRRLPDGLGTVAGADRYIACAPGLAGRRTRAPPAGSCRRCLGPGAPGPRPTPRTDPGPRGVPALALPLVSPCRPPLRSGARAHARAGAQPAGRDRLGKSPPQRPALRPVAAGRLVAAGLGRRAGARRGAGPGRAAALAGLQRRGAEPAPVVSDRRRRTALRRTPRGTAPSWPRPRGTPSGWD